ncbi:lipoprotein LpqH [Antrihabitans cavernicola]|uniref:Lipoprotein n=1 Tax=Antrihabitans cavernicola TaxID=2495913 RepID=A0A5A7S666_9NOCA|nr:lipoprotein LpqH [Spelaeibacter cavernicola]KAA0020215.1 hypothetical protein FOY51_21795 [Spelaeibacter cavernicola]
MRRDHVVESDCGWSRASAEVGNHMQRSRAMTRSFPICLAGLAPFVVVGCSDSPPPAPQMVATATVDGTNTAVTGRSDCWKGDNGTYFLRAQTYDTDGNFSDRPNVDVFLYKDSLSIKMISVSVSADRSFQFDLAKDASLAKKDANTYTISGAFQEMTTKRQMTVDLSLTCPAP